MILAIETSCDDTCVAILDSVSGKILRNDILSQVSAHEIFGGVVPEIASRKHLETLPALLIYSLKQAELSTDQISKIAVTVSPGLIGSLLIGINFAKGLGWSLGVPVIPIDHIEGHLLSVFLDGSEIRFPYLCLVASGGHSHFAAVKKVGEYELLGKTYDDAIGEAYDKTAKILGFHYPGGPILDRIAGESVEPGYEFPVPLGMKNTCDFSLSGLKTAVKNKAIGLNLYREKEILHNYESFRNDLPSKEKTCIENIVVGFQKTIEKMVLNRFEYALSLTSMTTIAMTGGVSANKGLRTALQNFATEKNLRLKIPEFQYCTDNAAMIAQVAFLKKDTSENTILLDKPQTSQSIF